MMRDPKHPDYVRVFVSPRVDHLAPAGDHVDPQPICGQKNRRGSGWDEYPVGTLAPYPDVRLCVRCAALAGD